MKDKKRGHNMWDFMLRGYQLYDLFYYFIFYGFIGWIYESTYISIKNKNLVNRGFLSGPIIPIYGIGATIIYLFISPVKENSFLVFFGGMLFATALEYVVSYVMELIFHIKWWDYSEFKYNVKGRICLPASMLWGVLSILMIKVLQPFALYLIRFVPEKVGDIIAYTLLILIIGDTIITTISTLQLDKRLTTMHRLREEFKEYIVGTKIFETREELIERYSDSQISEIIDNIKNKLEINSEKFFSGNDNIESINKRNRREEVIEYFKNFIMRYQKITEYKNRIQLRMLKAFPNFKAINREGALKDLKAKLHSKRK